MMGVEGGAIANGISKFRKIIEFESSYIVICFSFFIYLSMEKDLLSIKKVVKKLKN